MHHSTVTPIELFGHLPSGEPVHRITLDNGTLRIRLLTFGAVLQSIETPDRHGNHTNVVLGLTNLADYVARSPHFGAVPGRYAGRIARGRFTLDGVTHQLDCNQGANSIHGGSHGFGKRAWSLANHGPHHATLELTSPDGEAGYPGTVRVQVRYTIDGPDLRIDYHAETDRPTILNLTNHSYFNLAGEGANDIHSHELTIDSDHFLPIEPDGIPTGEIRPVASTPFDFRAPHPIGARIHQADEQILNALGYDHAYLLAGEGLRRAALLHEPLSGRTLTVLTTQPALQLYTANTLKGDLSGPSGRTYRQTAAVCLEAQHPQDSPNHPAFPSTELRPGQPFSATTIFRFGAEKAVITSHTPV